MMFVDTGAFVGRFIIDDQFHSRALQLWDKAADARETFATSNFVLAETITLTARRSHQQFAAEKARLIYSSSAFNILRPSLEDELAAFEWFQKYADQKVSFTDCVSFVLMMKAGIGTAFSFDRHFELAGFKLWA